MAKQRKNRWTQEDLRRRDARVWDLRVQGKNLEEIGREISRADGRRRIPLTKARVWQIMQREFRRRVEGAQAPEDVHELFLQARMNSLKPLRDAALRRLGREAAAA